MSKHLPVVDILTAWISYSTSKKNRFVDKKVICMKGNSSSQKLKAAKSESHWKKKCKALKEKENSTCLRRLHHSKQICSECFFANNVSVLES